MEGRGMKRSEIKKMLLEMSALAAEAKIDSSEVHGKKKLGKAVRKVMGAAPTYREMEAIFAVTENALLTGIYLLENDNPPETAEQLLAALLSITVEELVNGRLGEGCKVEALVVPHE